MSADGGCPGSGNGNGSADADRTDVRFVPWLCSGHPGRAGLDRQRAPASPGTCAVGAVYAGNLCASLSVCRSPESGPASPCVLESGGTAVQRGGVCGHEPDYSSGHLYDKPDSMVPAVSVRKTPAVKGV